MDRSDKIPYTCSVNGYWDARNHMVMDVLGYMFLLREGGDRLPEEKTLIFEDIESVRTREMEFTQQPDDQGSRILSLDEQTLTVLKNQKYWVTFDDQLFRKFTGKMTMHSKEILDLLLETSRVEFKIAFPVRLKENLHNRIEEKWYPMTIFSRPFEIGYKDNERKDGVVLSRTYFVLFNTILGELFVHNLLSKGYDWVGVGLYNLSPSAQFFYRHFLAHHNFKRIELNLETIAREMNFTDKNKTQLIAQHRGDTSLEPLKRNGLILSYEKMEGLHQDLKYVIYLPEKKISKLGGIEGPEMND